MLEPKPEASVMDLDSIDSVSVPFLEATAPCCNLYRVRRLPFPLDWVESTVFAVVGRHVMDGVLNGLKPCFGLCWMHYQAIQLTELCTGHILPYGITL